MYGVSGDVILIHLPKNGVDSNVRNTALFPPEDRPFYIYMPALT